MFLFQNPEWLIGIPVILLLMTWYYLSLGRSDGGRIRYSDISRLKAGGRGRMARLRHLLMFLRLGVLSLLFVAMARPQTETVIEPSYTEGVDIVIALDVSGSMQAIDLDMKSRKNRLEVSKEVIENFIGNRKHDRIGLVIFASSAFTQCPMTIDYAILKEFLEKVEIGMIDETSTAIGNALSNAVNRLKNSKARSKVIILLTDGESNAGEIDPLTAAEIAKTFGIRVYTIGAGSEGEALVPARNLLGQLSYRRAQVKIDEKTLGEIAKITGAEYYRARDRVALEAIFAEIDDLEKTRIETAGMRRYGELFRYAAFPALGLLLLEILLGYTRLRSLP
jgi:Ca-activated chloride channel homolog